MITLQSINNKIQKLYPESIILDIVEAYYPNDGWLKLDNMISPYDSPEVALSKIKSKIANGATKFNFKIKDEFDQIKYPDYSIKELSQ